MAALGYALVLLVFLGFGGAIFIGAAILGIIIMVTFVIALLCYFTWEWATGR